MLDEDSEIAGWLADRIVEIERFIHGLPSIAVLVNDEEKVRTIAIDLGSVLEDQNIPVIACSDGQVHGHDSAVRVFNIQHIKGLEFEAVFFVDGQTTILPIPVPFASLASHRRILTLNHRPLVQLLTLFLEVRTPTCLQDA